MALSACSLNDFKGQALAAINAMEPSGYWVGRPVAPSGAQSFSVVSPAYFTVATDPTMGMGLMTTGTPIPDNWNGQIVLRQTDPTDGQLDTTLTLPVVSSAGKPTSGLWAKTPTIHWLRRKIVVDRIAAERTLYYNPSATFAQTLTATTPAQLNTHFNTLKNAADGTSKYKILCQWNGILSGFNPVANANWGSGYLQIEAAPGYAPCLQSNITTGKNWSGVIFREIGFVTIKGTNTMLRFQGSVASGQAYNPRILFSKCKIGNKLWASWGANQTATTWGTFLFCYFAQEVIVDNECEISGIGAALTKGTIRIYNFTPKYTKQIMGDMYAHAGQYDANKPFTFIDPHCYAFIQSNYWDLPDNWTNSASGDPLHKDFVQLRPNAANMTPCTSYFHLETSFVCAGGYTYQKKSTLTLWKSPTVQVLMDNSASSLHHVEWSCFNYIFASDASRGIQVGNGNISAAWCSFPSSDRKPTANITPLAASRQEIGCGGETHLWGNLLSDKINAGAPPGCKSISGSTAFHYQENATVNFEGASSTAQSEPGAVTRGEVTAYNKVGLDQYWVYPLNYNQEPEDFASDLSRQVHHKAATEALTKGARLKEKRTVTIGSGQVQQTVNTNI